MRRIVEGPALLADCAGVEVVAKVDEGSADGDGAVVGVSPNAAKVISLREGEALEMASTLALCRRLFRSLRRLPKRASLSNGSWVLSPALVSRTRVRNSGSDISTASRVVADLLGKRLTQTLSRPSGNETGSG